MANSEPNAIGIRDTEAENGGVIREITAVSLENDTVTPEQLLLGATAHDAEGNPIVGSLDLTDTKVIGVRSSADEHGGTVIEINAVSLEDDTVSPENLLFGATAHNAAGDPIVGNLDGSIVNAIGIKDTELDNGGIVREITAVNLENDTVGPDTLLAGVVAHDAQGNVIVGNLDPTEIKVIGVKNSIDEHGGTVVEITAVSLEDDTVQPDTLLNGVTAHDAEGNPITGTMRPSGSQLILEHTIVGELTRPQRIIGTITKPMSLTGTISRAPVREVVYAGPYVVEPKFVDQILNTSQKFMTEDVTVKEIAVSRTSNTSGGITVYIGGLE